MTAPTGEASPALVIRDTMLNPPVDPETTAPDASPDTPKTKRKRGKRKGGWSSSVRAGSWYCTSEDCAAIGHLVYSGKTVCNRCDTEFDPDVHHKWTEDDISNKRHHRGVRKAAVIGTDVAGQVSQLPPALKPGLLKSIKDTMTTPRQSSPHGRDDAGEKVVLRSRQELEASFTSDTEDEGGIVLVNPKAGDLEEEMSKRRKRKRARKGDGSQSRTQSSPPAVPLEKVTQDDSMSPDKSSSETPPLEKAASSKPTVPATSGTTLKDLSRRLKSKAIRDGRRPQKFKLKDIKVRLPESRSSRAPTEETKMTASPGSRTKSSQSSMETTGKTDEATVASSGRKIAPTEVASGSPSAPSASPGEKVDVSKMDFAEKLQYLRARKSASCQKSDRELQADRQQK